MPHVMLVAGEPSGDQLGARLMAGLCARTGGDVKFSGVGGDAMAAQGLDSLFDMSELSVMGLAEVLPRIASLRRRLRQTHDAVLDVRPDAPRETAEFFPDAGGVHVQHDDGERARLIRVRDEGLHFAVGRADRKVLFIHGREYGRARARGSSDPDHAAPIC